MKKIALSIIVLVLTLSLLSCVEIEETTSEDNQDNYLLTLKVHIEDDVNGIGEYAYIEAEKVKFEELDDKYFIEFSEEFVEGSRYNWVLIKFSDGTGIIYPNSKINIFNYGKVSSEGMVTDIIGHYIIIDDEVTYKEKN